MVVLSVLPIKWNNFNFSVNSANVNILEDVLIF